MSRSLIQTANQSPQNVAENGIINLGSVQRRFGNNLRLSGNGIEATGEGYYTIFGTVTVAPTAAETVTVAVYNNGAQIPGVIASGTVGTASDEITLPLVGTIRQGGCCNISADNLTCVLLSGAGVVSNISLLIKKE